MSKPPLHPLVQSVDAKFNWGTKHLNALYSEIEAWQESKSHTVFPKYNDDLTEHEAWLRLDPFPDVIRWGLLAGDALSGFRCALDHLVYQLRFQDSRPPPEQNRLGFPIADSPGLFDKATGGGKLDGLAPETIAMIKRAQPYSTGNTMLAALRELNNIDKHQLLNVAVLALNEADFRATLQFDAAFDYWVNHEPIEKETPFFRLTFQKPHPKMEMEFRLSFVISLWHKHALGHGLVGLLSSIQGEVDRVITEIRGS